MSPSRGSARSSVRFLLLVSATVTLWFTVLAQRADAFAVTEFTSSFKTFERGGIASQAGSHPFSAGAELVLESEKVGSELSPKGDLKDVDIELPAGLIGDPSATPKCEARQFDGNVCPADTQVGVGLVTTGFGDLRVPLYNITPMPGVPAMFGFKTLNLVPTYVVASVRPGRPGTTEGFGIDLYIRGVSQAEQITAAGLEFFGTPRAGEKPFLTLPTSCGAPLEIRTALTSWQGDSASASTRLMDSFGNPVTVTGCELLPFAPQIQTALDTGAADSPSGLAVKIRTPQQTGANSLATANLKAATVVLPPGVSVDPSAAGGLGACTIAQFGQFSQTPSNCPDNSKIGSFDIDAPLLPDHLTGGVYLAKQGENPFGSLLALYLVAEADGVTIKLAGKVTLDPSTGQVTAAFEELPQLPFEQIELHLYDGPRAALATSSTCGEASIGASLAPWSGAAPTALSGAVAVTSGPGGSACPGSRGARPFGLGFEAGSVSPAAALHSPFALEVTRPDGAQELDGIEATLPEGLLASLKGVVPCEAADADAGSCGSASQIGTLAVGAGAGASPYLVKNGRAYLTGPYRGAPLGIDFVIPAVAGPIDLGTVNVRAALAIDPITTKVTIRSDPLPRILQGIPLRLRSIAIDVDRPGFMVNPTSCEPTAVTGQVTSTEGATATLSDRFQAAGCRSLAFAPKLKLALKGGTRRNGHPALTATLTQPPGQANLGRVSVTLPHSEFLEQAHIRTVCTRIQFAAEACPAGSVYGYAEALSPLLDQPLRGPVYLRSSSHNLPDLVAALKGPASEPIEIDLDGRIDSVRGAIRTSFEGIPDAPVSKFTLRLRGGKKSLIVNSTDLCGAGQKATVKATGQNGATHDFAAPLKARCVKGAKQKGGGKKR